MSNIVRLKKGLNIKLTENFQQHEYDCKCNSETCTYTLIDMDHVTKLQKLRDIVGPITITSAFRCESHNKSVNGSKTSKHLLGVATDIKVHRLNIECVRAIVRGLFNGVGIYDTFTHVDSRETPAEWDFRKGSGKSG